MSNGRGRCCSDWLIRLNREHTRLFVRVRKAVSPTKKRLRPVIEAKQTPARNDVRCTRQSTRTDSRKGKDMRFESHTLVAASAVTVSLGRGTKSTGVGPPLSLCRPIIIVKGVATRVAVSAAEGRRGSTDQPAAPAHRPEERQGRTNRNLARGTKVRRHCVQRVAVTHSFRITAAVSVGPLPPLLDVFTKDDSARSL